MAKGRRKTAGIPDGAPVIANGKRVLLGNQKNLSRLAQKGHPVNVYQHFARGNIDKTDQRQFATGASAGLKYPTVSILRMKNGHDE